jgi:hypothetical protein
MTSYAITFQRIGRARGIRPLRVEAANVAHLAEEIRRYVWPYLLSEDVVIDVDLAAQRGRILCGIQSGGVFTIGLPAEVWL